MSMLMPKKSGPLGQVVDLLEQGLMSENAARRVLQVYWSIEANGPSSEEDPLIWLMASRMIWGLCIEVPLELRSL